MKNWIKTLGAVIAAAALIVSTASCSTKKNDSPDTSVNEPTAETSTAALLDTPEVYDPEEMTITWLADYDLNPSDGESRSAALALFEDVYGGKINYVMVSPEEKYTRLAEMILSGEEVDMFPYEPYAVPYGAVNQQFEPLDPYFEDMGVEDGLWDDMADVMDMFGYGGVHYVVPYAVTSPLLLTYSRTVMQQAGLDDPYELYKKGEWTWDVFIEMMESFTADNWARKGICGDVGRGLFASSGKGIVGYDGSSLVNNLSSAEIGGAGNIMQEIAEKGLYRSGWYDSFPSDGSTLFMAMEDWTLKLSNGKTQDMDIMAVPFPKKSGADKYYLSCGYEARMLVKNSTKGKAVATYLKCERLAASEESFRQAAKKQALVPETTLDGTPTAYMTEEQYDAVQEYLSFENTAPLFDFACGMGERMYGMGDYNYETMGAVNNLETALFNGNASTWAELRDEWKGVVDTEISKLN